MPQVQYERDINADSSIDSITENGEIVDSTVKDFSGDSTNTVQKADKIGDSTATEPAIIDAVEGDSVSLEAASEKHGARGEAVLTTFSAAHSLTRSPIPFRDGTFRAMRSLRALSSRRWATALRVWSPERWSAWG